MNLSRLRSFQPYALSIMRMGIGYMFTAVGTNALFGFPPNAAGKVTPTHFGTMVWYGGVCETFGGALVILGLLTVPVAFLLCGEMAVAYFYAHAPRGFFPILNGGEAAILYCFVFLYLFFAGPGPWSIDAMMKRK